MGGLLFGNYVFGEEKVLGGRARAARVWAGSGGAADAEEPEERVGEPEAEAPVRRRILREK
jgi:hypothetical protein